MLSELGKRLEAVRYDSLPSITVEKAKTTILNFFAVSLAGADSPLTQAEMDVWESQGCRGDCVVVGHKGRLSALAAAAVNALMGQIFLLEDCHEATISHPGVVAIPVALALGQSLRAGGKQIIEAVAAGYESIGRIGSVLIAPGFPRFGLRPASTMAPFGGAAAAAKMMGLPADGIAGALAIAGNTASGVMEFVSSGTPDICIQNCFAAKNSVMAAMLAAKGVRAAPTILDGRFGLGRGLNQKELDWSQALAERPGYMIDDSFIKRFPGCGHVLATAQAAASLVKRYRIEPKDVEKVTVGVSRGAKEFPGVDDPGPYSGTISAMMSHQFMVASTLVHGEVSVATVKAYDHPGVAEFAQKVSVEVDADVDRAFPDKTGARLTVRLKNGEILSDFQEEIHPLTRDEVIGRFRNIAGAYFSGSRIDEIIDKTMNLESLDSAGSLMGLLESERSRI
jgi:2-methylcitrate dehydratase PrpD